MKLNWTKELEIEVTFANGTKEKIHLKAVADLKREKIPCLYTGSLDHDAEDSAVTVDGCQGDPQVVFVDVEEEGDQVAELHYGVQLHTHDHENGQWTPPEAPSLR